MSLIHKLIEAFGEMYLAKGRVDGQAYKQGLFDTKEAQWKRTKIASPLLLGIRPQNTQID